MPPDEAGVKNLTVNPPNKRGTHYVKHSMTCRFSDYQESTTEVPTEQILPHIGKREQRHFSGSLCSCEASRSLCHNRAEGFICMFLFGRLEKKDSFHNMKGTAVDWKGDKMVHMYMYCRSIHFIAYGSAH